MPKPVDDTKNAEHLQPAFTARPLVEVEVSAFECVVCGDGAHYLNEHGDAFCDGCQDARASGFVSVLHVVELETQIRAASAHTFEASKALSMTTIPGHTRQA